MLDPLLTQGPLERGAAYSETEGNDVKSALTCLLLGH